MLFWKKESSLMSGRSPAVLFKSIILIYLLINSPFQVWAKKDQNWRQASSFEPAALLTLFSASASPADLSLNDLARLVSGWPTGQPALKTIEEDQAWIKYRAFLDNAWQQLENKQLSLIETWSKSELSGEKEKTDFLFYPFGGPDFITVLAFFPQATTYLLVGLEPPGFLPSLSDLKKKTLEPYFDELQTILADYFQKGYFITREMNDELDPRKINGVLPLVCLFLERTNHSLSSLKRVEFDEEGQIIESDYTVPRQRIKRPVGFKLSCVQKETGKNQTVYYISCDLSDERFDPQAKFYLYLSRFNHWSCLIKSASYLLHLPNFHYIREMILDKSQLILQDDTGIPFKYLQSGKWEVKLYGRYASPVKDFSYIEQKELQAAYENKGQVKPLPFHFGYHWRSHLDNLIIAVKTDPADTRSNKINKK